MSDETPRRHEPREPVALLLAGIGMPDPDAPRPVGHGIEALITGAAPVPHDDSALRRAPSDASAPAVGIPHPATRSVLDDRLEALLMIADAPQPLAALAAALDSPIAPVRQAVQRLRVDYDGESDGPRRGFELRETAVGWRLFVRGEHDGLVREFLRLDTPAKLSQAALETLAVVAYRQPITRGQVAAVRAVSVDSVMRTLLARKLIDEVGQDPTTGAILYGTTDELLVTLGIRSIDELPPIAPLMEGPGSTTAEEVHAHAG